LPPVRMTANMIPVDDSLAHPGYSLARTKPPDRASLSASRAI